MNLTYITDKIHLICLPYTVENLHEMAKRLKIRKHFFHNTVNKPHYDLPVTRRKHLLEEEIHKIASSKELVNIINNSIFNQNINWNEYKLIYNHKGDIDSGIEILYKNLGEVGFIDCTEDEIKKVQPFLDENYMYNKIYYTDLSLTNDMLKYFAKFTEYKINFIEEHKPIMINKIIK